MVVGFFDQLNRKFTKEISSLGKSTPELDLRSKKRWVEEVGVSYDWWLATQMWWFAPWVHTLMYVHLPVIEKYGRYPYRNRGAGRESRVDEVKRRLVENEVREVGV
ncbi:hypothetical protein BDZ45DRAFT_682613 [Acephala macrosclerotiorum]|nr:hypothetical protein BDZ45DRAFT_682613 [Acephala macrosclerotiorum]